MTTSTLIADYDMAKEEQEEEEEYEKLRELLGNLVSQRAPMPVAGWVRKKSQVRLSSGAHADDVKCK